MTSPQLDFLRLLFRHLVLLQQVKQLQLVLGQSLANVALGFFFESFRVFHQLVKVIVRR